MGIGYFVCMDEVEGVCGSCDGEWCVVGRKCWLRCRWFLCIYVWFRDAAGEVVRLSVYAGVVYTGSMICAVDMGMYVIQGAYVSLEGYLFPDGELSGHLGPDFFFVCGCSLPGLWQPPWWRISGLFVLGVPDLAFQ